LMCEVFVPVTTIVVVVRSRSGRCGSMIIRFEWAGSASHWVGGSEAHFPAPTTLRLLRVQQSLRRRDGRQGKGFPPITCGQLWRRLGNSSSLLSVSDPACANDDADNNYDIRSILGREGCWLVLVGEQRWEGER